MDSLIPNAHTIFQAPISNYVKMIKAASVTISALVILLLVASTSEQVSGQITTACTSSLLTSFTPCFNFLTGSTNGGSSPITECCKSLSSLISDNIECACLIITGNVPISLPINQTLAISLPQMCKSQSVPLRCKGTATLLHGPGPVAYAPALPPFPSSVPDTGSDTTTPPLAPSFPGPAAPPVTDGGRVNQVKRPLVLPSSATKLDLQLNSPSLLMILALGVLLLNKF